MEANENDQPQREEEKETERDCDDSNNINDSGRRMSTFHHEAPCSTEQFATRMMKQHHDDEFANLIKKKTFSLWNPLTWFNRNVKNIEEVEATMFDSVKVECERHYVGIRKGATNIWTISANANINSNSNTPIVMIHDFAGGSALWVHNIDLLSESRPLYAFDLLGFGRSSRPVFSTDPVVAESQFVESIEDWRKEMKLERMTLLGSGFGSFLSTAYALKYPKHIYALILVDPWGFPEKPGPQPDTPTPLWLNMFTQATKLISPMSLIRLAGTLGQGLLKFVRPGINTQYKSLLDNTDLVYSYLYNANRVKPSGETGFMAMADYHGYAKMPMIRRINKVDNNIPIWFIYGSRSWVDPAAGFLSIYLRQNSVYTSVKLISGAGHCVYAEKSKDFNEYIQYILELIDEHIEKNHDFPVPSTC